MRRRLLAILSLVLAAILAAPSAAWAAGGAVSETDTTWTSGTWNVTQDVTLAERVEVDGEVVLHLGENTTLTASKGIGVNGSSKLTIEGDGKLVAKGNATSGYGNAGIGGTYMSDPDAPTQDQYAGNQMGTIVIKSGTIEATGGVGVANEGGAGIGSCASGGRYGSVTIEGGTVTAEGGPRGAGIGGGNASTVDVVINGGTIEAKSGLDTKGGRNAADIGGGNYTPFGYSGDVSVTINGGNVVAAGDRGIGAGWVAVGAASGSVSVTLGWTSPTDRIQGRYSLNKDEGATGSIAFVPNKTFIKEGDESRTAITQAMLEAFGTTDAIVPTTVIVTFDSAGGSDVDDQSMTPGEKATKPADPTRDDYAFEYWYTDDAPSTAFDFANTSIMADTTLRAKWQRITRTVSFDANGGGGDMPSQTVNQNEATKLNANGFTWANHAFVEWNTSADGTGTSYRDEQEVTLAADLKLYAQWRAFPNVSFDANGGKGTMAAQVSDEASSVTLSPNAFTKTRHVFVGWNTKKDGKGTAYADGSTIALSGDTTLYAQWRYGLTTSVKVGKGAPKLTCANLPTVAEKLVSDDEASAGTEVWLQIEVREKADIPASDAKLATTAATKLGATTKTWLDISLYKKVGGEDAVAITETPTALELAVEVPSSLKKSGRTFYLIRVHDDKASSIANTKGTKLSGQSKLFSTHVIAYKDASSSSSSKKSSSSSSKSSSSTTLAETGDPNARAGLVGALALGGAAVVAAGAWVRRRAE